jgi:peptidoglycan/xylan/chitin deacetylase (PgdA/CDA1 family)
LKEKKHSQKLKYVATNWTKDITNCTIPHSWGISYDDGPSPSSLVVLDALASHQLKATFFVTGTQITLFPDILIKMYQAGHTIGIQ